jgi:hypothetical protein
VDAGRECLPRHPLTSSQACPPLQVCRHGPSPSMRRGALFSTLGSPLRRF